jgi:DNA-binding beta-propeller fold protein YncE
MPSPTSNRWNGPSRPIHVVAGTAGRLYVVDTRGDALLVYATHPRLALLHRTPLAGTPYGVAIDPAHDRLWVTQTSTNHVTGFDVRSAVPRRLGSYPTGRQPDTVAVDRADGRVFVADAAGGVVEFFDPLQLGSLR